MSFQCPFKMCSVRDVMEGNGLRSLLVIYVTYFLLVRIYKFTAGPREWAVLGASPSRVHKVVWQHMQGVVGFLLTVYCKFTRESDSERILKISQVGGSNDMSVCC